MMRLLSTTLLFFITVCTCHVFAQNRVNFYVGSTENSPEAKLLYCELNLNDGSITEKLALSVGPGPGYIALSPSKKQLYVATQDNQIRSFSVLPNGKLNLLNTQPSHGINPCHISVHPQEKLALAANYTSGTFVAYPIVQDGSLEEASHIEQYEGSGPNHQRQDKPHAHCAISSPDGKFVYVADLGTDRIMNYSVQEDGKLLANTFQSFFKIHPGAGPRHMQMDPSGKFIFILNELDGTLTSAGIDTRGVMTEIQTQPTLPSDYTGGASSAAIRLHPNGKYVYISNRVYNAVHVYEIQKDGKLTKVDEVRQAIDHPRDFNIDPTGHFLIIANRNSNDLAVYQIKQSGNKHIFLHKSIHITQPSCIEFLGN